MAHTYGLILLCLMFIMTAKCCNQIAKRNVEDEILQIRHADDSNWPLQSTITEQPQTAIDKSIKSNYRTDPIIDKLLLEVYAQNATPDKPTPTTEQPQTSIDKSIKSNNRIDPFTDKLHLGVFAQNGTVSTNTETDEIIMQVFPITKSTTIQQNKKSCIDVDKICIPSFLCNDNDTIIHDMIDLHYDYDEEHCPQPNMCCKDFIERSQLAIEQQNVKCGYREPIYRGQEFNSEYGESQFGEFPWMVALLRKTLSDNIAEQLTFICGGAVISQNLVLTAAHCVHALQPELLVARAGEWDTQIPKQVHLHQDVQVEKISIHEQFNNASLFNDIALLRLATPYKWTKNVRPICLPPKGFIFDRTLRCYATGWGKNLFNDEHRYSVVLKKVDLPIVPHDTCESKLRLTRLGTHFKLHESFMCAGGEKGKDTCKGDGGSPLVCPDPSDPKRYYQAGIVAWGIGCASEDIPGTYANITYFADWLEQTIHNISTVVYGSSNK